MRLASFNLRAGGSRGHWNVILDESPDVLFVQETRNPAEFPLSFFGGPDLDRAYWRPVGHGKWGSAIHVPLGSIRPLSLGDLDGWVVGGHVSLRSLDFLAFSVHLPLTKSSYLRTAHRMLDLLHPVVEERPLILGGDWNVSISPGPRARRGENELHARLMNEFSLRSAWTSAHPDVEPPQTLRWCRDPATNYHCDGIWLSADWATSLSEVRVLEGEPWTRLSDHNPVVAHVQVDRVE
ncbi:MAG TPA: endonuclease/exonuclease/phosphatase family protein [Thermoanaerobaculia bacterium]|nr:endonuclease/exonuclease/phosphatase family protein [Thermoanaerobaculia bacterium]